MKLPGMLAFALLALSGPTPPLRATPVAAETRLHGGCGADYYINSRGNCVRRPVRADRPPTRATARCRDGTYSFSQSRYGACNWRDGVAKWL